MPSHAGPNTLGESNLVFAYDTGDTVNSYIGEPTTNLYTTLGFGFYQQEGNHTAARTVGPAPNLNLPSNYDYTTITTTGNWQAEVNRIIIWTNTSLTSGTYNISFWARVTSTSTATMGCAFYGNNINNTMSLTNQWQRFSIQSTTHPLYRATEFGSLSGAITFQIAGLQIESVPHATQYVNGIRSATQGLLPVIGNSTIDLTNVSFDSSAKMVFDGTNDYASVTLPSSIGVYCLEMVWYNNNAIPNNDTVIGGPATYQTPIEFNGTGQGVHLGAWTGGFTNEAIHIWGAGGATANQVAAGVGYHHVVFDWNGTTYDIWLDGVNTPTQYLSGNNPATLLTASSIKIGNDVSNYAFNGQIPITKIYNRALTAQEVRQNYQQYKTRFNLS